MATIPVEFRWLIIIYLGLWLVLYVLIGIILAIKTFKLKKLIRAHSERIVSFYQEKRIYWDQSSISLYDSLTKLEWSNSVSLGIDLYRYEPVPEMRMIMGFTYNLGSRKFDTTGYKPLMTGNNVSLEELSRFLIPIETLRQRYFHEHGDRFYSYCAIIYLITIAILALFAIYAPEEAEFFYMTIISASIVHLFFIHEAVLYVKNLKKDIMATSWKEDVLEYLEQAAPRFQRYNLRWVCVHSSYLELWADKAPQEDNEHPSEEQQHQANIDLVTHAVDQSSDSPHEATLPLLGSRQLTNAAPSLSSNLRLETYWYDACLQEVACSGYFLGRIKNHQLPVEEVENVVQGAQSYLVAYHQFWVKTVISELAAPILLPVFSQFCLLPYFIAHFAYAIKYFVLVEVGVAGILWMMYTVVDKIKLHEAQRHVERHFAEVNRAYQGTDLKWRLIKR